MNSDQEALSRLVGGVSNPLPGNSCHRPQDMIGCVCTALAWLRRELLLSCESTPAASINSQLSLCRSVHMRSRHHLRQFYLFLCKFLYACPMPFLIHSIYIHSQQERQKYDDKQTSLNLSCPQRNTMAQHCFNTT